MNDDTAIAGLESRKRIERLVARWDELCKERAGEAGPARTPRETDEDERRELLWLTPPTPYPGLRSFGPDEGALFFAREAQKDGLVQRLARSNIMVVLGGSGCGKSSLVRAGLIPRLSTSASVPGLKGRWYVVEFRPGLDPNTALIDGFRDSVVAPVARFAPPDDPLLGRRALIKALGLNEALLQSEAIEVQDRAVAAVRQRLFGDADRDTMRAAPLKVEGVFEIAQAVLDRLDIELSRGVRAGPPNLLMLIDQFEEAFRSEVTPEGQDNLCRLIKATFRQRPPSLFLALTLRSEELHRCAEAGLANIVTETAYLLGPLDDDKARREIIIRPAQAVFGDWIWAHEAAPVSDTAPFDPEVVRLLMQESRHVMAGLAHKSDYLPLLQHALQHLWNAAMARWKQELAEGGGVDLGIGVADLAAIADGVEPGFLVRCLNRFADKARDEAVAKAAAHFTGPDAATRAARVVRTAFCAMARKDDRGNWARRFASPARIAELLDNEPADRAAVKDVLRVFKRSGYLNRTGIGKDKKFDVSHEALIRNWDTYNEWLREIGALQHSLREVANNLEISQAEQPAGGLAGPLSWAWDWIRERNESRARELIPDRFREDIGKVVGPAKSVSVGLAAALLADGERRKSSRQPDALQPAAEKQDFQEERERAELENEMRGRIHAMAEPWARAVAASKRYLPRWVIVPSIVGVITVLVGGGLMFAIWKTEELTRSQNRLYFGAVAAAGNLDVPRWLEAGAFELQRVHNRIDKHRGEEDWAGNPSALNEMSLSMASWERAARQLTGAVVFRDPTDAPVDIAKANCSIGGTELMRQVGAISFGVSYDASKKSWWPRIQTASRADATPAPDARLYPLAQEGDMICLSQNVPLVMVWPAGQEQEPRFWMLGLTCQTFLGSSCAAWLPEPLRLRVTFSKQYANVQAEPPWRKLWRSKMARGAGTSLWANMDIYDFSSTVQNASARIGFAFKFDDEWLIADTTPGVIAPYVLSTPSNMEHVCTAGTCEFDLPSSKVRIEKENGCAGDGQDNCILRLAVEAVPSKGNGFLPIWTWTQPGSPIDVVTTDGMTMDFHSIDGLWRRSMIGVQALARHVNVLAGTMSGEPFKVPVTDVDFSDACKSTRCSSWKPPEDSASESWKW